MKKFTNYNCVKCNFPIYDNIAEYTERNMKFSLCIKCQDWYNEDSKTTTKQNKKFYLALLKRNVPVTIEKNDGYKTQ